MSSWEQISYILNSLLLVLVHFFILLMIKKMESIGIFVMLEQEDVIVTLLPAVPHLRDKSEPQAPQQEADLESPSRRRTTAFNSKSNHHSQNTSGWKSLDDGVLSI